MEGRQDFRDELERSEEIVGDGVADVAVVGPGFNPTFICHHFSEEVVGFAVSPWDRGAPPAAGAICDFQAALALVDGQKVQPAAGWSYPADVTRTLPRFALAVQ